MLLHRMVRSLVQLGAFRDEIKYRNCIDKYSVAALVGADLLFRSCVAELVIPLVGGKVLESTLFAVGNQCCYPLLIDQLRLTVVL